MPGCSRRAVPPDSARCRSGPKASATGSATTAEVTPPNRSPRNVSRSYFNVNPERIPGSG